MSYERLAYDDASTPAEMSDDCRAVDRALHLPKQVHRIALTALDSVPVAPARVRRVPIAVSDAAAKFAGRLFD